MNNVLKRDHRFIKKRIAASSLWFRSVGGASAPPSPFAICNAAGARPSSQGRCYSLLTLLSPAFDTQTLAPSNATPVGAVPTAKVPKLDPSLARNLVKTGEPLRQSRGSVVD